MKLRALCYLLLAVCLSASAYAEPGTAKPKVKGTHPFYRTALSNLRTARWMIYHHPTNWQPTVEEGEAVSRIDAAIAAIKKASIDDGKGPNDRPRIARRKDHPPRLKVALDCLKRARTNISRDGDKDLAEGLQLRAYEQIDGAIRAVRKTLRA